MSALGRGLGSLIPQKVNKQAGDQITPAVSVVDEGDKIWHVDPKLIKANDQQPRQDFNDAGLNELAQSIKQYGILQPLVVSKLGNGYQLITGERRLRAARKINLPTVPVIIRAADEQNRLELALIENIQRQDLNPLELAMAYRRLADEFNLTLEQVAQRLGKSTAVIANTIRFLNLPEEIQRALVAGRISEGHAKIFVGFDSEAKQFELFHKIVANKMTVAQAAVETQKMGGTKQARIKDNVGDREREAKLREFFGVRAVVKRKDRGGQIIIDFGNDEELGEIMKKMG
jgi:ParB family chromosome partitioning protein